MSRSTLPRLSSSEYIIDPKDLPVLGHRKDGRPIFPIMGGDESDDAATQAAAAAATAAAAAANNQQQSTGPVEATDEHGVGLGFPAETKTEDMTDAQRANYWRNQAKVQQKKVPTNLTELQQQAQQWQEYQRTQQTPAQQEIQKARDEAASQAREEAARDSALALVRVSLHTRGKSDADIDELLKFVNPASFLTDGKLNAATVTSYVDKIAPTGSGGGGGLPGQGRQEQQIADKAAAGKAEAERRGYKPADRSTSTLIPR